MRIRCAAFIAFFTLALCGLAAADSPVITFALPDLEGTITLGVFNAQGHLVRTLCRNAQVGSFIIGLNGLITKWDSCDDQGVRVPAGTYDVRGYVVGPVKVEGVDTRFNDWVDDDPSLQVLEVKGLKLLDDGDLILLANIAGPARDQALLKLFRIRPDGTPVWQAAVHLPWFSASVPVSGTFLAAGEEFACVIRNGRIEVFDSGSGKLVKNSALDAPAFTCACCDGRLLTLCGDGGLAVADVPDLRHMSFQPVPERFIAIDAAGSLLGGAGDSVWLRSNGIWERTGVAQSGSVRGFSLGTGKAFWITGDSADNGGAFVGEYAFDGRFLRQLREENGYTPESVSASRAGERIALVENSASGQRVRVLKQEPGAPAGEWKVTFQRAATRCGRFGIVNGKLVPDTDAPPQVNLKFWLVENSLTGGNHGTLMLHAAFDEKGTWLETGDGLRLVQVSETPGISRVAITRGDSADTMLLYQGNGATVDEFSITNLRQIAGIDAGSLEVK